jgi:hypothetical protein
MDKFVPMKESSFMSATIDGYAESYDLHPANDIVNLVNDPGIELTDTTNNNPGNDNMNKQGPVKGCKIRLKNKMCSRCMNCKAI